MNTLIIGLIIYSLIITLILLIKLINKDINYRNRLFMLLSKLEILQRTVFISDDVDEMWKYYRSIDDVIFKTYHGKDVV